MPRGDYVIIRLILLKHEPLHFHIVARMAPVAFRIQIAEEQTVLEADLDARQTSGDFTRNKGFAPHR